MSRIILVISLAVLPGFGASSLAQTQRISLVGVWQHEELQVAADEARADRVEDCCDLESATSRARQASLPRRGSRRNWIHGNDGCGADALNAGQHEASGYCVSWRQSRGARLGLDRTSRHGVCR